ncbi:MAG: putative metalloendopeptidase [Segetibacter sp.]|nr:putative metalloendopeptidase [Segetibacter sp.]
MKLRLVSLSSLLILLGIYGWKADNDPTRKFIETAYMDPTVKPGDNFFLYVNGGWLKTAVIPPTETSLGSALEVYNRTKEHLKLILDSVSHVSQPKGSIEQKVGDFYASGMDSVTIEKRGYDPVKPYLQKIDALTDAKSIMQFEAQRNKEGFIYIAAMNIGADEKNSSKNIAVFSQTGTGLPDRDYYFKTDPATIAIQKAYKTYMKKIFVMTGDDAASADKKVEEVYGLEKQIAESHRTRVQLRDPQSNYNKMAVADLTKQMPVFGWSSFLTAIGATTDSVNVGQPAYYTKLNTLLKTIPISTWKAFYKFHVTDDAAPYLSSAFVNARFDYYNRAINGQQQIKPRWERIYRSTDASLGEALGQLYVKKYFTEDAKKRMLELVANLQKSFEAHINQLDWMSDATKGKAKDKLYAFMKKIGFPEKWRDYSKVTIDRSKYFENVVSANKNEHEYQLSKLNKPVDKTEWGMTPPTINAYYNPTFNEIVFPAGILQFPFFDPNADDAINYGGIGMVIGHEMTHGFDDQGAQYDKEGNLKNWWANEDSAKFVAKSKSVIDLYNSFTVLDTVHLNGSLTTGENMADIGGIAIAYDAFKLTKQGQDTTKIDGFTPDQRFFISLGQIWRQKLKDETQRYYANVDPHSPAMYRVNGPLQNFTPFYKAFNVQPGDKMYLPEDKRITIW